MSEALALIIEDDPNLEVIFSEAIRRAGFETVTVTTGEEALEKLFGVEALRPNLIVLDFHLPGISGAVVLERIHASALLADTQLIITTADPLMGDFYRDQADFLLIKPVSFHQLRDLAHRLVKV